ncbi:DUF2478 domain-containing protein [Amaricoccus sp.]|uniref:DUF2478 domain-containing protein n=1 Tax=Amaricoccus sp. TaxID=1872485 RepID=UPI001B48BE99|nr:DUF2478 domain-containing protein [Amaricoccus sp.]MBP7243379.1 DUF2478 domain-containing protein [Amaricoccus sp.]
MARRIAVLEGADGDNLQALLAAAVAEWRAAGTRVAGVIAEAHGLPDRTCAAGFLREIGAEERFPIYLGTPPEGTSCHLDGAGVTAACAAVIGGISGSDLVVLSKFGKLEAAGQGLLPAFEAALAAGRPVLTTVSERHRDAWEAFAPDAARIDANPAALAAWWSDATARPR